MTTPNKIHEACHFIGPQLFRAFEDTGGIPLVDMFSCIARLGFAELVHGFATTTLKTEAKPGEQSYSAGARRELSALASSWSRMLDYDTNIPEYAGYERQHSLVKI